MIFQEPGLALDPVYTIGRQIAETVMRHEGKSYAQGRARLLEMLHVVRIPSARRRLESRRHAHAPSRHAAAWPRFAAARLCRRM
jgi:peptide/nickel transport system ATP-binding protein